MNDSTQVSISAFCLCCARLYMRKVKDFQAAKNAMDEREACPTCAKYINDMIWASANLELNPRHVTVNRLAPYG